jgi:hypothetical protein
LKPRVLIISPHNDDAAIGTFLFLSGKLDINGISVGDAEIILLGDGRLGELEGARLEEFEAFANAINARLEIGGIPNEGVDLVLAPSPESRHPLHKYWAWKAIDVRARAVAYYSTDMSEWWVKPLPQSLAAEKKRFLDRYFPIESELWEKDSRYFLFEGYIHLLWWWSRDR